jgi:hypothetical protein
MHATKADGGSTLRQSPRQITDSGVSTTQPTAGSLPRLLTAADMRAALGGLSERRFHELRAARIIPPPLELGPRAPRWTADDLAETISRLPRRERLSEPATLAQGRRARIDKMKAGA